MKISLLIENERIAQIVRTLAPIASRSSALPGQRRSVSLRFRVAMLINTEFAGLPIRGGCH